MKGTPLSATEGDVAFGAPLITQASHGFSVGDVIRENTLDSWTEAQADTEANIGVGLALVISAPTANTFVKLEKPGDDVTISSHGLGSFGTKLYLSAATPGAITATEPASGFSVPLGHVKDADTIHWQPGLLK